MPRSNHVYRLAPYETIDKKRYEEILKNFPNLDYSKLVTYEHVDETKHNKDLACAGNACEIDMITPVESVAS